ncbi:MAG TPA: SRPBCC family protein [Pyrinomonadaceae bacterium]|jgi:uncharacterized membrane protein
MAANETALTQAQIDRGDAPATRGRGVNVGEVERWASAIGGGALALYGLTRGTFGGVTLALVGGGLLYRGLSGHCELYQTIGFNTASSESENPNISVRAGHGYKVEQSITINRPAAQLYRYWRNFENLPRIMSHVQEVRGNDPIYSHWIVRGPAGTSVEWDAIVYNEKENELIAWRSLEGADVDNAGSVHFLPAPDGGTEVRVSLKYDPPAGIVGASIARLFGENPEQQIAEDLRRFKQFMETGAEQTSGDQSAERGASAGR